MKHLCSISGGKRYVSLLVCIFFLVQLTSCGTMLYPERRGQSTDLAQLDVKVVNLRDLADNREAETEATSLSRTRLVDSIEA